MKKCLCGMFYTGMCFYFMLTNLGLLMHFYIDDSKLSTQNIKC
uniref:Uncharacterized protein n=1 Tax=Rhizophora mucronata TaxID=61149 RepID=A0A2P2MWB9_RHIMU